jgi:hypothetical protein
MALELNNLSKVPHIYTIDQQFLTFAEFYLRNFICTSKSFFTTQATQLLVFSLLSASHHGHTFWRQSQKSAPS